jgi:hypothetical protein
MGGKGWVGRLAWGAGAWLWLLLLPGGCQDGSTAVVPAAGQPAAAAVYANRVIAHAEINSTGATAAQWPYFFNPGAVLGPPGGTLDVFSLGYTVTAGYDPVQGYDPTGTAAPGGSVTVGLGDPADPAVRACAVDGAGADLAVYENPFRTQDSAGNAGTNNEVATVEVSADGQTWYPFPHGEDAARPLIDPARYRNFAGVTPLADGGDRFDLADVIAANGLPADFRACYVRLTDGGTRWADYGNTQSDLYRSGADIDAVQALHWVWVTGLVP